MIINTWKSHPKLVHQTNPWLVPRGESYPTKNLIVISYSLCFTIGMKHITDVGKRDTETENINKESK